MPMTHGFIVCLPFIVLFAVWFFMVWTMRRGKGIGYRYQVGIRREALREEIVPEIKALRESIEALRKDLNDRR